SSSIAAFCCIAADASTGHRSLFFARLTHFIIYIFGIPLLRALTLFIGFLRRFARGLALPGAP
ncbi:MAG: MAPEG family protein, partial [Gammaproteobacteria bacterium]